MVRRAVGRSVAAALGLAIAFLALLGVLSMSAASAGEAQVPAVRGVLRVDEQPLEGVRIDVSREGGVAVGTATSDAEGRFEVRVQMPGSYTVTLAEDTLPEGVKVEGGNERRVTIAATPRTVIFRLVRGGAEDGGPTRLARVPQLLAEGLRFGLVIAMTSVGLSLIFGTTGLTNFSHGELVTFGAIAAWYLDTRAALPLVLAAVLGVLLGGVFGWVNDRGLWRPLRQRGTGLIAALVVSIGLALFLRTLYQMIFGGSTRNYEEFTIQSAVDLGPVALAPKDLASMAISVVALVAVALLLQRTRFGTATRAVADNGALASSSGIDTQRVITIVWIVGAALASLGGVLLGVTEGVNFQMGFQLLLLMFAGVTLGGLGTAYGALVGSLVVGVFIQLSTLVIPPELKNVGALAVLIVVLLVRPQGILGSKARVG